MNDHSQTRNMLTFEREIEGHGLELCSTFINLNGSFFLSFFSALTTLGLPLPYSVYTKGVNGAPFGEQLGLKAP